LRAQRGFGVGFNKEEEDAGTAGGASGDFFGEGRGERNFGGGGKTQIHAAGARTRGEERTKRFFRRPAFR
jgi:hypothetical protein